MKHNIEQLTVYHVSDSKEYIQGSTAIHLIEEARSMENGYYFYLTDEEIQEFETDDDRRAELIEEVENWILDNFPRYYIIDASSNDPAITYVMDESGETCHTDENCMCFDSEKEAQDMIKRQGWGGWAGVIAL